MSGTRAEAPRSAQAVATIDRLTLTVRKELTARCDPVVVCGEHLGETFVGEVRPGGECRWQVRDADPAERTILPGHFDPRLDHLGERGLDTARRYGVERRHQTARPHLVDDGRCQCPQPLRLGSLCTHQVAHPTCPRDDLVRAEAAESERLRTLTP